MYVFTAILDHPGETGFNFSQPRSNYYPSFSREQNKRLSCLPSYKWTSSFNSQLTYKHQLTISPLPTPAGSVGAIIAMNGELGISSLSHRTCTAYSPGDVGMYDTSADPSPLSLQFILAWDGPINIYRYCVITDSAVRYYTLLSSNRFPFNLFLW